MGRPRLWFHPSLRVGLLVSIEDQLEAYRRRNVMGVSLIPAEAVADLAALLASERFRYTTGDILTIDGGLPEAFPR